MGPTQIGRNLERRCDNIELGRSDNILSSRPIRSVQRLVPVHYWRCLLLNGRCECGWLTHPDLDRLIGRPSLLQNHRTAGRAGFSASSGKRIVSGALREVVKATRRCGAVMIGHRTMRVQNLNSAICQPMPLPSFHRQSVT